jgi:hypothetical protein
MKSKSGLFLVSLLVSAFCQAGFSAEKAPTKSSGALSAQQSRPASAKKTTKLLKYRGKVSDIDSRSGTVSINGAAGEKRFVVQDAAKDAVERLAVGDSVRVTYAENNGKLAATSLRRVRPTRTSTRQTQTKQSNLAAPPKAPAR